MSVLRNSASGWPLVTIWPWRTATFLTTPSTPAKISLLRTGSSVPSDSNSKLYGHDHQTYQQRDHRAGDGQRLGQRPRAWKHPLRLAQGSPKGHQE